MPDNKISSFSALTAVATDDELVIVDKSDTTQAATGTTKKITKANLVPQITPASSSAPASLDLHEDTDNGTNKITLIAPSAIASDKVITLPDETGTVVTDVSTQIKTGWIPVSDSWSYASADAPTFTITVPSGAGSIYSPGMRIKLTQTTVKYFIVTAVADTVLTVYGGTDYTLVNAAISAISYSTQKAPFGFPLSPAKWTVEVTDVTLRSQNNPTQNQWYNAGSITISAPIGLWEASIIGNIGADNDNGNTMNCYVTLSTANNSESNTEFTSNVELVATGAGTSEVFSNFVRTKILSIASKTSYYLNFKTNQASVSNIYLLNDRTKLFIRLECAYL